MVDPADFRAAILSPLRRILAITLAEVEAALIAGKHAEEDDETKFVGVDPDDLSSLAQTATAIYSLELTLDKEERPFD